MDLYISLKSVSLKSINLICPLRIIISYINSPLYELSLFLHKLIINNIPPAKSKILNSFELVDSLAFRYIGAHYKLMSLDVVSLFTNVPCDLAIANFTRRWESIKKTTRILLNAFVGSICS